MFPHLLVQPLAFAPQHERGGRPVIHRVIVLLSALVQAARELFGNIAPNAPAPTAWPLVHAVPYVLIWVAGILIVFVPLAVAQFKRAAAR